MSDATMIRLRERIDALDARMLELLRTRLLLSAAIAERKRALGLPTLDAAREAEKRARAAALGGASAEALQETLMALSRAYQDALPGKGLRCGLVGEKLGHSYSPKIHGLLGAYDYRLIELSPDELQDFFEKRDFDGLNVTIPYKKAVLPLCDELTARAKTIGSVNTVVRRADGTLLGDNTDFFGFCCLLRAAGIDPHGKKALVLGSGGASLTVQAALRELGAREIVVVSREGETNYVNLYEKHPDAQLLVNATPVGMAPNTGESLVLLPMLPRLEAVVDLIYNPARTKLLLDAERLGLKAMNGLGMLTAQAAAACERFTGRQTDGDTIRLLTRELEREMKNLVLVGMPGCGKSSVGRALAERLGRPFADCDTGIEERCGRSIPEIFDSEGEAGFRRREQELLRELSKRSGLVIACGGGALTQSGNLELLRQNAIILWLRRDLKKLPTEGRPLSQSRPIEELYRERETQYREAAELVVDNDGSLEETLQKILEALEVL